ncbi:cell division protein DedD [Aeromonas schubertii]|uniref:Cell division protein DedD n=1 Tax=Aeromonas schubertii TaxID=652 RepID=A0ABS7V7L0_9GAMM|nr:cell division protein DedD [Aeromonas schubertii]KUE81445.1 DedD protein [Aeromonas schubertii]MBZ6065013.1 cell division protein DedD [Aeromonas schubertii]
MASQFQNRLVGTIILVALVVIFLPDLLDGNKQQEVEDAAFAKIPLRPELEPAKPALQVSGAADLQAAHEQAKVAAAQPEASGDANSWQVEPIAEPVTVQSQPVPQATVPPKPEPEPKPKPKPAELAQAKPKPVEAKPNVVESKPKSVDPLGDLVSSLDKPKPASPSQGAWIIQLGAFKNVESVNSIVAKLRAAGYPAHTIPRTPRQGELNRVVVGPDVSRDKLQGMLPRLNQLTALSGSVVAYNP